MCTCCHCYLPYVLTRSQNVSPYIIKFWFGAFVSFPPCRCPITPACQQQIHRSLLWLLESPLPPDARSSYKLLSFRVAFNPPPTIMLDDDLVYHADIIIFCIILIFALPTLPRAYARFSNRSEWSQGHRLSLVASPRNRTINSLINLNRISRPINESSKSFVDLECDDPSSTTCESLPYRPRSKPSRDAYDKKELPMTPQRLPPPSFYFHPVSSILRHRVHDNYSIGQVLLMLVYITIISYVSFYKSNPFTDPHRAGFVITSQIPFVYALATKNNIIGFMVGVGYEKVCFISKCPK